MAKLTYSVFKTIMMAMILVFVFDMLMYLYRTASLTQRMQNIMTGMQRVVQENNGLSPENYKVYEDMFIELADSFNQGHTANNSDTFINGFWINFNSKARDTTTMHDMSASSGTVLKMNNTANMANYGDIIVVQVGVCINQPNWNFTTSSSNSSAYFQNDRTSPVINSPEHNLWYTYYVPCLKYTQ